MKNELTKALDYDGLAEAEKLTGNSYKEDANVVWLGMGLMHRQQEEKDALLFLNRDTNSNKQTISEFFDILKDIGFVEVLKLPIPGTEDHFHVFWKSGLLIRLDTWNNRCVNGGDVYFNYQGNRSDLHHASNGLVAGTDDVWGGYRDIREGFRNFLDIPGKFLAPWVKKPFLWLLHYQDTKVEGYSYEKINAERIDMLPAYVREDLGI